MGQSRRGILKGGLALLGGLAGAGTAGRGLFGRATAEAAPGPSGSLSIELHGASWSIASRHLLRGQLPRAGDRMTASGILLDAPADAGGREIGEFYGAFIGVSDPGHDGPSGIAGLEQHTFRLADGSIMGAGLATRDYDQQDVFAVVGGTGRYTGARGSYVAVQRHRELGGDGTATFTMTVFLEGEAHGG